MLEPLRPARLAFAADGTPFSEEYGDLYHSAAGGPAQARHVFLAGNGLPARWRGRARFTILETGFGFGLSFLVAWQAWRDDGERCERLHFVSIEKHPFGAQDLAVLHARYDELQLLAQELRAAWPVLVPGLHRLELEQGRVVLTLALGDIAALLPQLRLAADAFYLDGFAPAKNPEMWSPQLLRHLGRLAAPGATAATWSVAAPVREALREAGFRAAKRRGFARKSEMLVAELAPRRAQRPAPAPAARKALVIGAGIAGAAVSERLASRGWDVTLIERHAAPAEEASGNPAGIIHPVVTPDDSLFARLTRSAFFWQDIEGRELRRGGVLQLARDAKEDAAQRALAGYPPEYVRHVEREEASRLAGVEVTAAGLWFPGAGWLRPRGRVGSLLARCGPRLQTRFEQEAATLDRGRGDWIARDARGAAIAAAPVVILANAAEALRLAPQPAVRLRRVRGQLSLLPPGRLASLRTAVLRGGFVLPPVDGRVLTGASFDLDDDDPGERVESHAGNLERLERIVPGAAAGLDPARLEGRVAFRAVARDRLPLVGALAQEGLYGAFAYGSRGLLWAGIAAELLASLLEGEPLPLERRLAEALDPGRFARRAQGRSSLMSS